MAIAAPARLASGGAAPAPRAGTWRAPHTVMTSPLLTRPLPTSAARSRNEPPLLSLRAEPGGMPRPSARERAQRDGVSALSDADLIALLLATGASGQPVARVAQELLNE